MSRCPALVIVGRPNVGKSTLFNRVTRSRRALVADRPGVTRDFQETPATAAGYRFTLVDTGGLGGYRQGLEAVVEARAYAVAKQADVLLWIVDGRAGVVPADQELASKFRKLQCSCLLVLNKSEGASPESVMAEFYELGIGSMACISARHGDGVPQMLEQALRLYHTRTEQAKTETAPLPGQVAALEAATPEQDPVVAEAEQGATDIPPESLPPESLQIAIVGRPNSGKSTLVNRILGEERMLTSEIPGTTRDSVPSELDRRGMHYRLIDTAGVRRRARVADPLEKFSAAKSRQAMEDADVVVLLVDAVLQAAEQDVRLYRHARNRGKPILIALNKWDGLNSEQRHHARESLEHLLRFDPQRRIHPVSALEGSGLGELFKDLEYIRKAGKFQVSTARLNGILKELVDKYPPPGGGRRGGRLLHVHLGGRRPPRVILHGRRLQQLPGSYRSYLQRGFSLALEPKGLVPIQLELREV